jgi:hypothetical protein
MQRAMVSQTKVMADKCRFLCTIHPRMLDSATWISLQTEIYNSVNEMMLEIIKQCQNYPHKPKERGPEVVKHFKIRDFLARVCLELWDKHFPESDSFNRGNKNKPKNKIDLELLMPTMRSLGMMDCLDIAWNMYGDWNAILQEMEKHGAKHVPHTIADTILAGKSKIWRSSRNSMTFRLHYSSSLISGMSSLPPYSRLDLVRRPPESRGVSLLDVSCAKKCNVSDS